MATSFSKLGTFGGKKKLIRLQQTHGESSVGMPGPSCPVGIPHLVKGGAATQPSGSHETGGESAHGTLGMGPEKGETAAFTVQFSLIPHTFSCSHRNPP